VRSGPRRVPDARMPARLARPAPPAALFDPLAGSLFLPAPELVEWALATFVREDAPLLNELHLHLRHARIGAQWTNVPNVAKQRRFAATAETPRPPVTGGKWARGRWEQQLREWFGEPQPDFVLTFDAGLVDAAEDLVFCATLEHELLHCGQAVDEWGAPRFSRETGKPLFALVGHDVEEHVNIIERYGVDGGAGRTREFVAAAARKPVVGRAAALACGTCARLAA